MVHFLLFAVLVVAGFGLLVGLMAEEVRRRQMRQRQSDYRNRHAEAMQQTRDAMASIEAEEPSPPSEPTALAPDAEEPLLIAADGNPELLHDIEALARDEPEGFGTVLRQMMIGPATASSELESEDQTAEAVTVTTD